MKAGKHFFFVVTLAVILWPGPQAGAQINPYFDLKNFKAKKQIALRMGHGLPEGHPILVDVIEPFFETLSVKTGEFIKPVPVFMGERVYDQFQQGELEMAHIAFSDLQSNHYRGSRLLAMPFLGKKRPRGEALWALARGILENEYKDIVLLSVHIDEGVFVHSGKRPALGKSGRGGQPVVAAEDFANGAFVTNHKVAGYFIEFMGGRVLPMQESDKILAEKFTYGEIDGLVSARDRFNDRAYGEVLTWHYHLPEFAEIYILVMSKPVFNALPAPWQDMVRAHTGPDMIARADRVMKQAREARKLEWVNRGHDVVEPKQNRRWRNLISNFVRWQLQRFDQANEEGAPFIYNAFDKALQ